MARRQSFFDDLMKVGFSLPWRVAVLLAAGSFVVLHVVAINTPPLATGTTLAAFWLLRD